MIFLVKNVANLKGKERERKRGLEGKRKDGSNMNMFKGKNLPQGHSQTKSLGSQSRTR